MKHIILAVWKFHTTMWDHRNSILHANSASSIAIRDSPLDACIRSLYQSIGSFAATDQVLFAIPLDIRLSHSCRAKKHWVALAKRYQSTTTSRQTGGQHLLTKFFVILLFTSRHCSFIQWVHLLLKLLTLKYSSVFHSIDSLVVLECRMPMGVVMQQILSWCAVKYSIHIKRNNHFQNSHDMIS